MANRLSRNTLNRAKPENVRRLAKFIGLPVGDCLCHECNHKLIEELVRKLDIDDIAWPPRLTERKW